MSTFWKNLHRLSQDQLFTRGYLSPAVAQEMARKRQVADSPENTKPQAKSNPPWPRLAALR
jgi:hypothetical protein